MFKKQELKKLFENLPSETQLLADYNEMGLPLPDEFFPKAFKIKWASKDDVEKARLEYEMFRQEFRMVYAESLLKTFDGELTPQVQVALRIAEKRLFTENKIYVNDTEWEILQMPNLQYKPYWEMT